MKYKEVTLNIPCDLDNEEVEFALREHLEIDNVRMVFFNKEIKYHVSYEEIEFGDYQKGIEKKDAKFRLENYISAKGIPTADTIVYRYATFDDIHEFTFKQLMDICLS